MITQTASYSQRTSAGLGMTRSAAVIASRVDQWILGDTHG
jgi:hypothetical protein